MESNFNLKIVLPNFLIFIVSAWFISGIYDSIIYGIIGGFGIALFFFKLKQYLDSESYSKNDLIALFIVTAIWAGLFLFFGYHGQLTTDCYEDGNEAACSQLESLNY